ncbi:ABC transporter ATP-binding protein [Curvibacter sp. APW13]|uniref:ABC transporter ATP-binding protein n=1 Tax=Curvibacter sp. APW13 TaxID=3077236 RepID=UPI0028DE5719|nr:ABC transporter ATP-binding protein [Curvibacter sp. APW13]MDT8990743.1 ABC transporter ATP-binding protein [Curvibacter sp. APW13]
MTSTTPANDVAVAARGVAKQFGRLKAVDGVDLAVHRGEIFGLIGHNGAGKSTLFKMMLGLLVPSSGQIQVDGVDVQGPDFRAARRRIGYLPEHVVLYDNLNGLETLQFFAQLKGAPLAQCQPVLEQVGLKHAGSRPVREYSKGMRQRLGFAQALLGNPQVLFLDEPTNGLDPQAIRDFYTTLRGLCAQGVTIVITSHILAELQERVDRLGIMANGRLQAVGTVAALRAQMDMPLVIVAQLSAQGLVAAQQKVLRLPGVTCTSAPGGLSVQCPRERKVDVLAALSSLGSEVHDLQVQEPSLEDVFLGWKE